MSRATACGTNNLRLCDKMGIIAQKREEAMDTPPISIDSNLYRLVKKSAKERHVSIQSLIERVLSAFVATPSPQDGGAESHKPADDETALDGGRPNYIISPRMRRLTGVAEIGQEDVERDGRLHDTC